VALVAGPYFPSLRDLVRTKFWQLAVTAAVLAFIGYALPLLFWNPIAGPTPPWVMAVAPAALGLAALAPWGYGEEAGGAGLWARLLLPVYLIVAYLVLVGPPDFLNFAILDWTANTTPLFRDFQAALPYIETPLWGGLFLKLVISGIVNSFIGLFMDTTLVLIIGLFDLLGAVQQAAQNQRWLGFSVEGYVFAAFGFWIFCFGMSRYSIFVEKKLETGHKR